MAVRPTPAGPAAVGPALRVLVVDDEPHNRRHVQRLLARAPDARVVGTAADGAEALAAIRDLRPDLVFLDVQMPEMTGLDVVRAVGADAMPVTVFVTAFDRYAVDAFDVAAVDYLVKPYDDERFARALARARQAVAARRAGDGDGSGSGSGSGADAPLEALLRALGNAAASAAPARAPYLERFAVEVAGHVRPVPADDVDYITADGPYAELHVGGRRHVIREAMQALEERLDPARFMRVHRSAIVRLAAVEELRRVAGGDGEVLLRGGARLRVSRTRREALERWLGVG